MSPLRDNYGEGLAVIENILPFSKLRRRSDLLAQTVSEVLQLAKAQWTSADLAKVERFLEDRKSLIVEYQQLDGEIERDLVSATRDEITQFVVALDGLFPGRYSDRRIYIETAINSLMAVEPSKLGLRSAFAKLREEHERLPPVAAVLKATSEEQASWCRKREFIRRLPRALEECQARLQRENRMRGRRRAGGEGA